MKILSEPVSNLVAKYVLGREHPAKQRLIRWFFRLTGSRVVIHYGSGGKISLDLSDGVQDSIFRYGAYEPEVWTALESVAKTGDVFWDIGANIGSIAIRAVLEPRFKNVFCFEAHPVNYKVLVGNLGMNPSEKVKPFSFALGERAGQLEIASGPPGNAGGASLMTENRGGKTFRVQCKTIDQVLAEGLATPPTLLKLDVEGWELAVLKGATELFRQNPPRALVLEAAVNPDGTIKDKELEQFLVDRHYRRTHIARTYGRMEGVENFLFARQ